MNEQPKKRTVRTDDAPKIVTLDDSNKQNQPPPSPSPSVSLQVGNLGNGGEGGDPNDDHTGKSQDHSTIPIGNMRMCNLSIPNRDADTRAIDSRSCVGPGYPNSEPGDGPSPASYVITKIKGHKFAQNKKRQTQHNLPHCMGRV